MTEARILVVEDEAIIAKDIEQTLKDYGYRVLAIASSGEEAIQKARETQPDLVLMDIVLKGRMNGIEAAREIRAALGTPIVFLTAYADEIMLEEARMTEPSGYLVKPFQGQELRSTIEVALYKHGMDRKLKEKEGWLAGTLRSIHEAVITTRDDGTIVLMNPLAEFLTEWKAEEAIGRPLEEVFQVIHEGNGERIALPLEKVIHEWVTIGRGNSVFLIGKNGRKRPVEYRISPIGGKEMPPLGTVLVFRDITVRKEAEEAIQQERELLERITQNIGAGVAVISKDYRTLWANRVLKEIFGKTEGKPCYSTYNQQEEVCPNCGVREVFDKKKDLVVYEEMRKDKGGNPIWSQIIATPLRDRGGSITAAVELVVPITERKKAEEEIERIRLRNEMILNSASEGIMGLDECGKVTFINKAGASLLGYEVKELLEKEIHRIWNPMAEEGDPILKEKCAILRSIKEGSSLNRATDIFWRKDGSSFQAEYSCNPFSEKGRITGAVVVFRDITQRKRTIDVLRVNERKAKQLAQENRILMEIGRIVSSTLKIEEVYERFAHEARKLIPANRISVLTLDDQKTVLTIQYVWGEPLPDRKAGDLTPLDGSLSGEVIKQGHGLILNMEKGKDQLGQRLPHFAKFLNTGLRNCMVVPLISQGVTLGVLFFFSKQSDVYTQEHLKIAESIGNQIAGAIASAQHYRQMKRAMESLQESEGRYRALISAAENAGNGIVVLQNTESLEGVVVSASGNVPLITGYSQIELLNACWLDKVHPKMRENFLGYYRSQLKGEPTTGVIDIPIVHKNGREVMIEFTGSRMLFHEKPAVALFFRDITQRKIMGQQLSQTQKLEAIGQLAAGIAHEINTPIQYIGDNLRFLEDSLQGLLRLIGKYQEWEASARNGSVGDQIFRELEEMRQMVDLDYLQDEIPKAIQQSLEGVDRVAKIVLAMKEFAHPAKKEKAPVDINKAIETTVTLARNEWKYVADVALELDPSLPPVPCLRDEFNQAILNILINAAHAIGDVVGRDGASKGTITIQTLHQGRWAEIRISDTGTGIPEEIQGRIFDPFFTTKQVGKGTGQGLPIAHSVIVDKHGGTIHFESQVGKGTTFIIRLPLGLQTPSLSQSLIPYHPRESGDLEKKASE